MSIIFAAQFRNGVAIGSDSLRHDQLSGMPRGNESKVRRINDRVYASKAGYGPDADNLWSELAALPGIDAMGPNEVAEALRSRAVATYDRCKLLAQSLGTPDPGLYLIVAGLTRNGSPAVHYMNITLQDFHVLPCAAFGPNNTVQVATQMYAHEQTAGGGQVAFDRWATRLVDHSIPLARHSIGYPVYLTLLDDRGATDLVLTEGHVPLPEARRRV